MGALLEALLQCPEELECLEDQGCQEADTATQDVSASTCPATWGLDMDQDMDQDLDMDLDQGLEALDLVPHHFLPLVAMEQVGNSELGKVFFLLFLSLSVNYIPLPLSPHTKSGQK